MVKAYPNDYPHGYCVSSRDIALKFKVLFNQLLEIPEGDIAVNKWEFIDTFYALEWPKYDIN